MPNYQYSEKRNFLRYPIDLPLCYIEDYSKTEFSGETQNISEEGIGLVTDRPLTIGSEIFINMKVNGSGETIYRKGSVLWTNPFNANKFSSGIKILGETIDSIRVVLKCIQSRRKY